MGFAGIFLAVFLGQLAGDYLARLPLKLISGVVFIALGALAVLDHFRTAAGCREKSNLAFHVPIKVS